MESLRQALLADPYFRDIPSFKPERKKTAQVFHAKDDLPEVRYLVFKLLLAQKVRFYGAVRDKREAALHESRLRESDPTYRYRPNEMYDALVGRLFGPRWSRADHFDICFSKRGKSDRTAALWRTLRNAAIEFERNRALNNLAAGETSSDSAAGDEGTGPPQRFRVVRVEISHSSPVGSGGLQAVDYFLWALQRFYEYEGTGKRDSECRYVEMIHELTGEIDDLDFVLDGKRGVVWGQHRPLTVAARLSIGAKKKRRI